jgi:hypothetical protein
MESSATTVTDIDFYKPKDTNIDENYNDDVISVTAVNEEEKIDLNKIEDNSHVKQVKKTGPKCMHNIQRRNCRICGDGKQFCTHGKYKQQCRECGGKSFCIHNRQKVRCRECSPHSFCLHNKRKERCGECYGRHVCEHRINKYDCSTCIAVKHAKKKIICAADVLLDINHSK